MDMKVEDIKILLDAYYEGETNPEQENILLEYFHGGEVADELKEDKEIFLQLNDADKIIEVPQRLEDRLENLIDALAEKEKPLLKVSKKNYTLKWITSIAASIVILIGAGIYFNYQSVQQPVSVAKVDPRDTFSDPDLAYEEASKALMLISKNLNKGMDQLSNVQESIEQTNEIVRKSFEKIN